MKRRLFLIPAAILAIFLDAFVFPFLSGNGIRPLCTMSLALAATAEMKVQDGMLIAFFGGILIDLFCNPYVGLTPAVVLIAVCIVYGFTKKGERNYALLFVFSIVASAAAEILIFGFSLIIGARFEPLLLLSTTLPSVVIESLLVLPLAALFRKREKENGFNR